ncbi:MAG TPA: ABC transporter substrate-binding protein [Pseudolabrys sp.]|jgi:putative ABC transport system substrate-binding protein
MRRREFITLLGGVAAWPLTARAQQTKVKRVGMLIATTEDDPQAQRQLEAFRRGLLELGWAEGRDIRFDARFPANDPERMGAQAAELVALKPDALLASGQTPVLALQRVTRSVPIVFTQVNDPVDTGLVATLARPGGNVTGFTPAEFSIGGKSLELLKELAPNMRQVGVVLDAGLTDQIGMWRTIVAAAPSAGVQLRQLVVQDHAALDGLIDNFAATSGSGLIVLANRTTILNRKLIVSLAAKHRLPSIYSYRYFVNDGGLASYGADLIDLYRRSASYVDRILKGEKPADLPVQQPNRYELVINLKTAKALGLTVPPSLLTRADEVIE